MPIARDLEEEETLEYDATCAGLVKDARLGIEGNEKTGWVVTGEIASREGADMDTIRRIAVTVRRDASPDGTAPLIGRVQFRPPFEMPLTFALPCGPSSHDPSPADYSAVVTVYPVACK